MTVLPYNNNNNNNNNLDVLLPLSDVAFWWSSIECGGYHSLALTRDGRLFSWGWGVYGQLALGDTSDVDRPTEVATDVRGV